MVQLQTSLKLKTPKWQTLSFKTPYWLYVVHRILFRMTNGLWNDGISKVLKAINGQYSSIDMTESLFKVDDRYVDNVTSQLDKNGFCILEHTLPEEFTNSLVQFAKTTKVKGILPTNNYRKDGFKWSTEDYPEKFKNLSARCVYESRDLVHAPIVQKLALEPLFLSIANRYLRVRPILSLVYMWWSFSVPNKEQFAEVSAQAFHFDMDRLKWVNFFIYLNDVGPENGPHCYVRGSHKKLPKQFLKRGRFTDSDIQKYYGDDVVELTGKKGTIIAVDTRGLHKGKLLENGERLIFQLIFSNSLFGQQYEKISFSLKETKLVQYASKYWHSYFNVL